MFYRVVRSTFQGLIQWPDLMVFGLLSFGLALALQLIFAPIWESTIRQMQLSSAPVSPLPSLILLVAQQLILTVGSMLIVVAATRVALARLRGREMSIGEGLRIGSLVRPVLIYCVLYAVISVALVFAYLFFLFGPDGLIYASQLTTTGFSGLSQVPTSLSGGTACLVVLVFLPTFIAWALANMLVAPVIAAEGRGGWAAITRSWTLVIRTFSMVVGLILSAVALTFGLIVLLAILNPQGAQTFSSVRGFGEAPAAQPLINTALVMNAILTALLFVIGAIFSAAWYLVATETEVVSETPASGVTGQ